MLYLELGVFSSRLNLEFKSTLYRDCAKLRSELGRELYDPTEPEPLIDMLEPSIDLSASVLLFKPWLFSKLVVLDCLFVTFLLKAGNCFRFLPLRIT